MFPESRPTDPFLRRVAVLCAVGSCADAALAIPAHHRKLVCAATGPCAPSLRAAIWAPMKRRPSSCLKSRAIRWFTSPPRRWCATPDAQRLHGATRYRPGFIWDDAGHVVTNFHVIEGRRRPRSNSPTGATIRRRWLVPRQRMTSPCCALALVSRPPPVPVGTSHDLKGGAEGVCHRQPVRPRLDAHQRHCLGAGSFPRR